MSKPFWIVTEDVGYPEAWLVVRLADGTIHPIEGPFKIQR
jgi:hypothetical protein